MGSLTIPALTLWPEWAWAICYLGKRVENRSWPPPPWLLGERLAIHAGKSLGGRPGRYALDAAIADVSYMARAAGWTRQSPAWSHDLLREARFSREGRLGGVLDVNIPTSAIVAIVTVTGADREHRTPWDVPGWHWRLADVEVLAEPLPCAGKQGLWRAEVSP